MGWPVLIGFGVCCGSIERLQRWVVPRVGGQPLVALYNQTSIAEAYNSILDLYAPLDVDAVVLQHDDLEITDPDAEAKILAALRAPGVALVGVAGGAGVSSLAWWNARTVGKQQIEGTTLRFERPTGQVDLLEGSLLAFSPAAVEQLRFDPEYPGFHGYDEVAMAAKAAGMRVEVIDLDTYHHVGLGFKSAENEHVWHAANGRFREKWGFA